MFYYLYVPENTENLLPKKYKKKMFFLYFSIDGNSYMPYYIALYLLNKSVKVL